MNTVLWLVQPLLAVAFLFASGMKSFGIEKVLKDGRTRPRQAELNKANGVFYRHLRIAGSLGVILPRLTGVMPQLTPTAAAGRHDPRRRFSYSAKRSSVQDHHNFGLLGLMCIRGIWAWQAVFWLSDSWLHLGLLPVRTKPQAPRSLRLWLASSLEAGVNCRLRGGKRADDAAGL